MTVASTDAVVRGGATIAKVTLSIRWTDRTRLAVGAIGVVYALGALAVARGSGTLTTYAGRSGVAAALAIVAGLSLIVGGLVATSVRPTERIGDLAVLAGVLWFMPVWDGWLDGPALIRSLGMVASVFTFALLLHLVLAYPGGGLRSRVDQTLTIAVYGEAALVAIGLALFRDPFFDPHCWNNCTDNGFLISSLPWVARGIVLADRWFTVAAATALTAVCLWRLAIGSATTRRTVLPVFPPTLMLTGAIWGRAVTLQRSPREDPSDPVFYAIFVIGSVGVVLLAVAVVWAAIRSRLQRRAVARIVADLGDRPAPGSLGTALAQAVGDPELRIAYWLPDSARFVDANGSTVAEPTTQPGRVLTSFTREDRRIAVVSHAASLSDLPREMGTAVQLGLENERLQAEVLSHLEELRASRGRIVETGDAERRRLERDLHDGAQQRLLALSYDIRIALAAAEAEGDEQAASPLRDALDQAQVALTELRELAHGIYPAILVEAGLGPALETLADAAPIPVEIHDDTDGRCSAAVEAAAYLVVAEAIDDAAGRGATFASVGVVRGTSRISVSVEDDGSERGSEMVSIADRVGAVGGELALEPTSVRAEMPCVS
jgi:signal transduction histidine kinase